MWIIWGSLISNPSLTISFIIHWLCEHFYIPESMRAVLYWSFLPSNMKYIQRRQQEKLWRWVDLKALSFVREVLLAVSLMRNGLTRTMTSPFSQLHERKASFMLNPTPKELAWCGGCANGWRQRSGSSNHRWSGLVAAGKEAASIVAVVETIPFYHTSITYIK